MNISRVRFFRKQKGLSQKELADLCGLSVKGITSAENNIDNVNMATLKAIAKALGVKTKDLYEELD